MRVILLERIGKLGKIGDIVEVADGFARNFLLKTKKALRANPTNLKEFESKKSYYEEQNLVKKKDAEKAADKFNNVEISIISPTQANGVLYGSVTVRNIVEELAKAGYNVERTQVDLPSPLKNVGEYSIKLRLHPEVETKIKVFVGGTYEEITQIKNPQLKTESKVEKRSKSFVSEPIMDEMPEAETTETAEAPAETQGENV